MGYGRITSDGSRGRGGEPAAHVRHLLQRVPGQLLAPLDRLRLGPARPPRVSRRAGRSSSTARPPRATCQRADAVDGRAATTTTVDVRPAAEAVHRRRLVLVRHRGRRRASSSSSDARLGRRDRQDRARHGLASASRRSTVPTSASTSCVNLSRASPAVLEILDEVIVVDQGTQRVARPRALRRGGRGARRQAPAHRAGQPRRLGRLLARHERGDRQGRRRLRPAPRRRRRLRARGHPARGRRSPTSPSSRRWSAARCSASTTAR